MSLSNFNLENAKRPVPYYTSPEGSDSKPVLYGVHLSDKKCLQFTMKFGDQKCYQMSPSWRVSGGKIPYNRDGYIPLRCSLKGSKMVNSDFNSNMKFHISVYILEPCKASL